MAKQVTTTFTCDNPAHAKKCPTDAGVVTERRVIFGKKVYEMDLCNDSYTVGMAQIMAFLKPAIEQGRVIALDTTDYKLLAAKWWVELPEYKPKYGYTRGAFGAERMEAFTNAHSVWEKWKPGDDIPDEWKYNPETGEVTFIGEGKP